MDLGSRSSYLALERGTDVLGSDHERVGEVVHVLFDEREDVFDGIVIALGGVPHRHVFADADEVAEIFDRAVVLTVDADGAGRLPEPSENPAVLGEDPGDRTTGKLRRAWDRLTGNY